MTARNAAIETRRNVASYGTGVQQDDTALHGGSCDDSRGGSAAALTALLALAALLGACGGGGSGVAPAPATSGTLVVADCTIAAGASSCQATINWTSTAAAPRVLLAGATVSTVAAGTASLAVGTERQPVALFDGATRLDEKSIGGSCASASAWDGSRCIAFAIRSTERAPTPFVEGGVAVTLEVVMYRPPGNGPFPLAIFHHGSTGNGDDPSQFRLTYTNEVIARFFAERGWMVAFPQRRGRGTSGGLYDEGFTPDRARYSCLQVPAMDGLERAISDADAVFDWLRMRPDVDATRLLSAGFSRGGLLAAVHAARRPSAFRGVVNFVGGWLGEGCADSVAVNRGSFIAAAAFPAATAWLYGENDPFYSVAHSTSNFDAFRAAGGQGTFSIYRRAAGLSGHLIINDPALWGTELDSYLRSLAN